VKLLECPHCKVPLTGALWDYGADRVVVHPCDHAFDLEAADADGLSMPSLDSLELAKEPDAS